MRRRSSDFRRIFSLTTNKLSTKQESYQQLSQSFTFFVGSLDFFLLLRIKVKKDFNGKDNCIS